MVHVGESLVMHKHSQTCLVPDEASVTFRISLMRNVY